MEKDVWKEFCEYVNTTLEIPKEILNLLAVNDILFACVVGLSNKTIANRFNLDIEYIKYTLKEFLDFEGWEYDLDLNAFNIYKRSNRDLNSFSLFVDTLSSLVTKETKEILFGLCEKYEELFKKVEKYYD